MIIGLEASCDSISELPLRKLGADPQRFDTRAKCHWFCHDSILA